MYKCAYKVCTIYDHFWQSRLLGLITISCPLLPWVSAAYARMLLRLTDDLFQSWMLPWLLRGAGQRPPLFGIYFVLTAETAEKAFLRKWVDKTATNIFGA